MPHKTLWKTLFIVLFLLLTYLLLMEMKPSHDASAYKDKLQHIVAFGGVAFWGILAFEHHAKRIVGGLVFFGGLIEVLQGIFTVTRQPSVYDWLADIVGVLLAWLMVSGYLRWKQARG